MHTTRTRALPALLALTAPFLARVGVLTPLPARAGVAVMDTPDPGKLKVKVKKIEDSL